MGKKPSRAREKLSSGPGKSAKAISNFFIIFGLVMIAVSFISEINFHYLQGFKPDSLPEDVFWRAEYSEVFNSIAFLVIAGFSFLMAWLVRRNVKC